ncbi:helix-turn-helix domain-containing protein [Streptomyces yaizuensis]|uniref:Helix-turn-helix domain-containing protein n=1 Tax=Streptomyces yaizuensis TaxID=2989713 RepID=A0ABQ5P6J2_9ACTN|nr:helix-turn-helix transcriptional regulator [Streptomyces sp. YSPA8]GLF98182.1 helix-turn-helix domain-containing protein [Streptomyces sp. YSPA8]
MTKFHPDLRRRRGAVLLAVGAALEQRPSPSRRDEAAFVKALGELVAVCLPGSGPADVPEREISSLLHLALLQKSDRYEPRVTEHVFDGDLLIDGAIYEPPPGRLGVYAGSAPDPDASPRRLVARLALYTLTGLGHGEEHLAVVREVLPWAVDAPVLVREMVVRREVSGRSRADVARVTGVSVSTVGNWESGQSIPHRQDWPAVCTAYGFGEEEFGRLLDLTGPPERRGAPHGGDTGAQEPAEPAPLQAPPDDDCELQARRVTEGAARVGAVPVWRDAAVGGSGIGGWYLDLCDDGEPAWERSRAGRTAPPATASGGVLGPVDLSALMHRQDWTMWLISTSGAIGEKAGAHMDACLADRPRDAAATAAFFRAGTDLSLAYQHALNLHPGAGRTDSFAATADRAVASALSKIMIVMLTAL